MSSVVSNELRIGAWEVRELELKDGGMEIIVLRNENDLLDVALYFEDEYITSGVFESLKEAEDYGRANYIKHMLGNQTVTINGWEIRGSDARKTRDGFDMGTRNSRAWARGADGSMWERTLSSPEAARNAADIYVDWMLSEQS